MPLILTESLEPTNLSNMDPTSILIKEFEKRRAKNEHYSLRAFARDLNISSGALTEILSKKRPLTLQTATRVFPSISHLVNREAFFLGLQTGINRSAIRRPKPLKELPKDKFEVVVQWQHFAILSLLETTPPVQTINEIAKRLKLNRNTASKSLARLHRLGLVTRQGNRFHLCVEGVSTPSETRNEALQKAHLQMLTQTLQILKRQSVDERSMSAITIATDPSKLNLAKTEIKKFRRRLCRLLESGSKTQVYRLQIQFIPLS